MPFDIEGKNILCHNLFEDKFIQNCLKIDATHLYDKKPIAFPQSWYNNNKKNKH